MDGRQVRHIIVSFDPEDHIGPFCASQIAFKIAEYYRNQFQVVYGVHKDTDSLHIHFIIHTVSYIDGRRYSRGMGEVMILKKYVQQIINSYMGMHKRISLDEW